MIPNVANTPEASGDPLATVLAIAAVLLSLLAVIVPAATGRQQMRRDDRAKRSEMYLELMELIERHGIWVVDRTYDLLETSHEDFYSTMPHRRTERPDRTQRVRARAIVSAYASSEVLEAYSRWQTALELFEEKLDELGFIAQEDGPDAVDARTAEPLRDSEVLARTRLANTVNSQLVNERRWRRGQTQ